MTIKDFNSKIHASSDRNTLLNALGRFARVDNLAKSVFEDTLNLAWAPWVPDGGGGLQAAS